MARSDLNQPQCNKGILRRLGSPAEATKCPIGCGVFFSAFRTSEAESACNHGTFRSESTPMQQGHPPEAGKSRRSHKMPYRMRRVLFRIPDIGSRERLQSWNVQI